MSGSRINGTAAAAVLALALVAAYGCATKGYVRKQVAEARLHTDSQVASVRGDLNEVRTLAERLASGAIEYNEVGSQQMQFGFDDYRLSSEALSALDQIAGQLVSHPKYVVEIRGYADALGSDRYNYQLGEERADEVARYLMTRHAVPVGRIAVVSFGEENPIAGNESDEGRAHNRRVVVRVLEITSPGEPLAGAP